MRMSELEYEALIAKRTGVMKELSFQLQIPAPRDARKLADSTIPLSSKPLNIKLVSMPPQGKGNALQGKYGAFPAEDVEQVALAQYLDYKGLKWAHVPNGGQRSKAVAGKLKAQGVKPGVPDCLIFETPPNYPMAKGVAIELKRIKGGTVSQEQRGWLDHLGSQGWCCHVARGWKDAQAFLTEMGW